MNPRGFTDQLPESFGLTDFNARYYDPLIGRFVSADSLVPGYENPQNLNRYSYALGNPVNYVDPSGHATECSGGVGGCDSYTWSMPGGVSDPAAAENAIETAGNVVAGAAVIGATIVGASTLPTIAPVVEQAIAFVHMAWMNFEAEHSFLAGAATGTAETAAGCAAMGGGCTPGDYLMGATASGMANRAATTMVDPAELRWTQTSAGGNGRAVLYRQSMEEQGWIGPPIDVIQTSNGLVTVDHTRATIALEMNMREVPANIHSPNDPLPQNMITTNRFGNATTWMEAITYRSANQRPPLPPTGTTQPPRLR